MSCPTVTETGAGRMPSAGGLVLRPGRPDEAAALSGIAVRSKAFWGYSASFMRAVTAELTLDAAQAVRTVVAEVDGGLGGFHLLEPARPRSGSGGGSGAGSGSSSVEEGADGELVMLFVDPEFIGTGLGRVLFEDARSAATARGWHRLLIEADPHSSTFYERLGAVQVGERLSGSIPGRSLPLLELLLRPAAGGPGGSGGAGRASYWR